MATEASRSGASSADSYIGSLISLTSKSEIRYEGVLFNINTEESSIGLRNVRSFGSEGRKKDGPQIPASDKIYDYILFRGKDIKDLQVKSSPPPQPAPIHNDPAIIQSHYSRSAPSSTSLSSIASGATTDGSQTAQLGLTRPTFPGDLSPYQAGGNLGSWGPTPPTANVSGLAVPPVYWQGYYAPSGGLPHLQPPMLQQPPGLALPSSMQQSLQYPVLNTSLPSGLQNLTDYPPLLFPPVSNSLNLTSSTLPSASAPAQASVLAPEPSVNLISNKPPATSLPATSLGPSPPLVVPLTSNLESVFSVSSSMPSIIGSQSRPVASTMLPHQTASHSIPSNVASSISNQVETLRTSVTHGQLLQPGSSTLPSSQSSKMIIKEVDTKPPEAMVKPAIHESSVSAVAGAKEPILPLPTPTNREPNGIALHSHQNNRGRGRGRGRGNAYQRPVTQFSEDFDFIAMNEKFNKDEVWGHLGKNKAQLRDREGDIDNDYADDEEDDAEAVNLEVKPVYVKDEFFDSLSCNTLDHGSRYGRPKFSEQMKIDTETFGDFSRQRSGRGRGRGFRGGGRGRGSYYGRGYGYAGRGSRGYPTPNRGP